VRVSMSDPEQQLHLPDRLLQNSQRLTQTVIQITEMLCMSQAELARILGVQCADIGELANGKRVIETDSETWTQATRFVEVYEGLYHHNKGDGVAMRHWLRRTNSELNGVPLLLMVDENKLETVLGYLKKHHPEKYL